MIQRCFPSPQTLGNEIDILLDILKNRYEEAVRAEKYFKELSQTFSSFAERKAFLEFSQEYAEKVHSIKTLFLPTSQEFYPVKNVV